MGPKEGHSEALSLDGLSELTARRVDVNGMRHDTRCVAPLMRHQYFYFYNIINYQCKYNYVSNTVALCYLFLDTIQIKLQFLI